MVDHTFVYTRAVKRIRELTQSGALGEIYYYDSVRINLGLFPHDVNVLWDLAVHDLSIMDYLIWNEIPTVVGNLVGGLAFTGLTLYATHVRTAPRRAFD